MMNKDMERLLAKGECLDVEKIGQKVDDDVWALDRFEEGLDYCVGSTEQWIWSVGHDRQDGRILASTDARFYDDPRYLCLWLR